MLDVWCWKIDSSDVIDNRVLHEYESQTLVKPPVPLPTSRIPPILIQAHSMRNGARQRLQRPIWSSWPLPLDERNMEDDSTSSLPFCRGTADPLGSGFPRLTDHRVLKSAMAGALHDYLRPLQRHALVTTFAEGYIILSASNSRSSPDSAVQICFDVSCLYRCWVVPVCIVILFDGELCTQSSRSDITPGFDQRTTVPAIRSSMQ